MNQYIAFFRAINVGGYNKIKMQDLRDLFISLSFKEVKSYIQTGNIIFKTDNDDEQEISNSIISKVKIDFGYDVKLLLMKECDLIKAAENNPFATAENIEEKRLHMIFLSETVKPEDINKLKSLNSDRDKIEIGNKVAYLLCYDEYRKTAFGNNKLEKILKVQGTTRNWNTVSKVIELCNK